MNSEWKWDQLRLLIEGTLAHNVQYSHDKAFDRYSYQRVLEWMDSLDKRAEEKKTGKNRDEFQNHRQMVDSSLLVFLHSIKRLGKKF